MSTVLSCRHWLIIAILANFALAAGAAELDDKWATLSEASTRLFYRGRARSDLVRTFAQANLSKVSKEGSFEQRKAADAIIDIVGKDSIAKAETALKELKQTERDERDDFILDGLLDPKNANSAYFESLVEIAGKAAEYAEAYRKAVKMQNQLQARWRADVLPAIVAAAGPESEAPLLKVQYELLVSDLWLEVRNVSGKTLTNCTLNMSISQGTYGPADVTWFIRKWEANQIIRPEYVRVWGSTATGYEALATKSIKIEYQVWSDQASSMSELPTSVEPYSIRDPFARSLFQKRAKYIAIGDSTRWTLEFTNLRKQGAAQIVDATLRTEQLNGKGKVTAQTYTGNWTEDRTRTTSFHPAIVSVHMTSKPQGKEPPLPITFEWNDGKLILTIGFVTGIPLIALPDKP